MIRWWRDTGPASFGISDMDRSNEVASVPSGAFYRFVKALALSFISAGTSVAKQGSKQGLKMIDMYAARS